MITAKDLSPNVPRRGTAFSQRVGELWLRLLGWKVTGEFPSVPKAVFIGAPHTSNRDGIVAAAVILSLRLKIRIMAKAELFKGPMAPFFRWLGVMPVYRSKSQGLVEQSANYLKQAENFYLGIAPEGTRHGSPEFKRGFYLIAVKAGVPIIPFILDFGNKELRLTPAFYPTGDMAADIATIIERYRGVIGANPDRMSAPLKAMLPKED
jgi:1-acyl-sn-glycerol-3-phosphate acyltransferase